MFKLVKEVRDDRCDTSRSCSHQQMFKLVKDMRDDRVDISFS